LHAYRPLKLKPEQEDKEERMSQAVTKQLIANSRLEV